MMPPRPTVAVSTVAPLCMTATIDTMPVCGKYMCSISSPTSCSITPRSRAIVRRCGASREKSCGGNAAKNRLGLPCSSWRATGVVPYGIDGAPALRRDARVKQNQVKIAFTDSALRSAYRSDVQLIYVQKVPMTALRRHRTSLYHPPGTTTRCGGRMPPQLVCEAVRVNVVRWWRPSWLAGLAPTRAVRREARGYPASRPRGQDGLWAYAGIRPLGPPPARTSSPSAADCPRPRDWTGRG